MKKAIVLLSGGLDSSTTLYYAKSIGYICHCLIFDYGQRHRREIESARRIAQGAKCEAQVIKIALPWKGSALLDKKMKIPKKRGGVIPSTYVPGRNIIFLSFALSCAEALDAGTIFIGANAIDYSNYPDCRPEFFRAFQNMIDTGMKMNVIASELLRAKQSQKRDCFGLDIKMSRPRNDVHKLHIEAPLINKSKREIVKLAKHLRVPLELTWSCYKGAGRPCGVCDSCVLRAKGFREAGMRDPLYGGKDN